MITLIELNCKLCHKTFLVKPYRVKRGQKYCSLKCSSGVNTGKKHSLESRKKMSSKKKGISHPMWNGGKRFHEKGYIYIHQPDHPFATQDGYVREHRLIMEKSIGRYLDPDEVIHHINHNKTDNRLENLMLFDSHRAHLLFEWKSGQRGRD